MAKSKPIAGAVLVGTALLGGLLVLWGHPLRSQVARPNGLRPADTPGPEGKPVGLEDEPGAAAQTEPALTLPTDPAGERKLQAVKDYVKQEAWPEATRALQSLLEAPDAFVPLGGAGADGKEAARWTTLHAETDRLLGALPVPGRAFYELSQGAHARALLARATDRGDPHLLAEVSRRYLHTAAGATATRLLGAHHLDRGRHALAALCFERLLGLPDAEKLPPAVLFPAALAFRRAGDKARAGRAWEQLSARAPGGLRVGGKPVSLAELQAWLAGDRPPEPSAAAEWPLFRGDAARSALCAGGGLTPKGFDNAARGNAPVWHHATAHETATQTWVQEAVRQQEARGEPALPAFFPVAADGKVVYRSYRGIHAVDSRTGRLLWESESMGGLDTLGLELSYFPFVESWVNAHLQHNPHVVFGNSVVGSLSTDGERVYAVDDLAVPPYQNTYHQRGRPVQALDMAFAPGLTEAARHSRLTALDLRSGKLVWEVGSRGRGPGPEKKPAGLYPGHFLGPPLPVGGSLYGLIEKDQDLRLICLDAAGGERVWELPLGVAPAPLTADPARSLQAVSLAYADGVLVCPTNAGFVLGVDPIGRRFLWAYGYREAVPVPEVDPPVRGWGGRRRGMPTPLPPPVLRPMWAASAPVVSDGKVVFTAPDGPSVHCLGLRDGAPLWKAKRAAGDLYLAGVGRGKVVLVGKRACRALDLADGKPRWEVATGLPSGLGALSATAYYLPLKATARDKQPAVCAIDLDSGRMRERAGPARKETPGNLLFYRDSVLSQTATAITAYPPLTSRHQD
jgi:outer membrane protein assembly factor BamB